MRFPLPSPNSSAGHGGGGAPRTVARRGPVQYATRMSSFLCSQHGNRQQQIQEFFSPFPAALLRPGWRRSCRHGVLLGEGDSEGEGDAAAAATAVPRDPHLHACVLSAPVRRGPLYVPMYIQLQYNTIPTILSGPRRCCDWRNLHDVNMNEH